MSGGFLAPGHAPLKFHPLANLFPMLADAELDDLGADIQTNGQVETVKLHRGMVLDGRNRYTACGKRGIGVRTEIFQGTDREALAWVISKNLKRRHLTESQRAMVAAKLATLRLGDNQQVLRLREAAPIGAPAFDLGDQATAPEPAPIVSQTEAAEMMNVARRSVQRAAVVQDKGAPELQAAVDAGTVKVSAAADIAALPIDEQRKIIAAADPKVVKEVSKKNRVAKQAEGRTRRLANMAKPDATPLLTGGGKVGVFYVDIPREFEQWSDETGADKSPNNHYRTEKFEFLAAMREQILARAKPNSVMFMWAWANSLLDQIDLLAEWGFSSMRLRDSEGRLLRGADGKILPPVGEGRYRTHQIWAKRSANGNLHQGMGFWFRDCHEVLLIGARGDVPAPLMGTQALSIVDGLIGDHSEKPDAFRDQIDQYFPGVPKLELFGRVDDEAAFKARWPDWQVWGNHQAPPAPNAEAAE